MNETPMAGQARPNKAAVDRQHDGFAMASSLSPCIQRSGLETGGSSRGTHTHACAAASVEVVCNHTTLAAAAIQHARLQF